MISSKETSFASTFLAVCFEVMEIISLCFNQVTVSLLEKFLKHLPVAHVPTGLPLVFQSTEKYYCFPFVNCTYSEVNPNAVLINFVLTTIMQTS